MFQNLFKLRGELSPQQKIFYGILGFIIFIAVWALLAEVFAESGIHKIKYSEGEDQVIDRKYINEITGDSLRGEHIYQGIFDDMSKEELASFGLHRAKRYIKLPQPWSIVTAIPKLIKPPNYLLENTRDSLITNFVSYIVAILIAIPIGFIIGLVPLFRGMFGGIFDAIRFIPLAAITFLFILWFGLGFSMKVAFLAFGILVYLIPVVVQRIDEVQEVYLKTVFTLGATNWQTIKSVYIPSVLSRISDDIRVLTAISWTYITIAEMAGGVMGGKGGLGYMIYRLKKQSNTEYVFLILIIIIIIGILQDVILKLLDKWFFPYKYVERGHG